MRIAVARDEAFNFTYQANIDALKKCGEVVFFSPLSDTVLPECSLLYLPGGYPELFAEALSQNTLLKEAIWQYAENEGLVFAECGGMMYLTQSILYHEKAYAMCGVLPFIATMENAHLHLGYREIPAQGNALKGHEFHYSEIQEEAENHGVKVLRNQFSAKGKAVNTAIYRYKNVIAGYTHWYWAETGFKAFMKQFNVSF